MIKLETFRKKIQSDFESFKSIWNGLTKQEKGDVVTFEGKKYKVESVIEGKETNVYTICRMESPDGITLQLVCHKIEAKEGELK